MAHSAHHRQGTGRRPRQISLGPTHKKPRPPGRGFLLSKVPYATRRDGWEVARTTTKGDVVFVDSWTDKTNKAATISALCTIIDTEDEPILVSLIAKDNSWKKATTLESIKTTTLYSVSAKTEPLTRPYERPQTGSALDTITVAYLRKRWQEVFQDELEKHNARSSLSGWFRQRRKARRYGDRKRLQHRLHQRVLRQEQEEKARLLEIQYAQIWNEAMRQIGRENASIAYVSREKGEGSADIVIVAGEARKVLDRAIKRARRDEKSSSQMRLSLSAPGTTTITNPGAEVKDNVDPRETSASRRTRTASPRRVQEHRTSLHR